MLEQGGHICFLQTRYNGAAQSSGHRWIPAKRLGRVLMTPKQTIVDFMASEFPQNKCLVEDIGDQSAVVRRKTGQADLRPGGTVSGPVLMEVADVALYVAILGNIGIVPLAVTTNLTINFLRKPLPDRDIMGICKLIKSGKSLVVGEVTLYSEGSHDAVAHAVGTYSIPPAPKNI
jgi:acyl-coenzyme A thioesterase PaaI-like protein